MLDFFLDAIAVLSPLAIAIMSVVVGIRLAKDPQGQSHKYWWWGIIALGIICSSVTLWQQDRGRRAHAEEIGTLNAKVESIQKKLSENTNATVGLKMLMPRNGVQELVPNKPIEFNVGFAVTMNTARNLRGWEEMVTEPGASSSAQAQKAWIEFISQATARLLHSGEDRILDTGGFGTVSITLQKGQIDEVMAGKRMVYILARQEWVNPSGSDGHLDTCKMLETPKNKSLGIGNTAWHDCLF